MNFLIIICAKYLIFIVGILAFAYWLRVPRKQKIRLLVLGLLTGIIAIVLAKIGSSLFYDARPFVSDNVIPLFAYTADNGFPSDHTLLAASIAVAIFFVSKKWGIGFMLLAVIIGLSRVLANVHHPVDIIGSFFFTIIGGLVAYAITPKVLELAYKSDRLKRLAER